MGTSGCLSSSMKCRNVTAPMRRLVGVVQVGATVADPALQPGEILARADTGLQQAESGDEPVVVVWGRLSP